jgi:hypothetical protein
MIHNQFLSLLYGHQPLAKSNMHLSFSNLGDETVIGGFNMDQPKSDNGPSPGQTTDHI